tara:strand:- start:34 stop:219 length:186 start_codon:yes stop_codon:yes gene_type:complete
MDKSGKPLADDCLAALEKQRNDALNVAVNLQAENTALRRALQATQGDTKSPDDAEGEDPDA